MMVKGFAVPVLIWIFMFPGSAQISWVGFGVSCEPVDIGGGGFFFDVAWNMELLALGEIGTLSARPMFGLGPLPLRMRWFILDALFVAEFPQEKFVFYAGAGYGVIISLQLELLSKSLVAVVGLSHISLAEDLQMYAHVKVRGEGFFASPGLGLQWHF